MYHLLKTIRLESTEKKQTLIVTQKEYHCISIVSCTVLLLFTIKWFFNPGLVFILQGFKDPSVTIQRTV